MSEKSMEGENPVMASWLMARETSLMAHGQEMYKMDREL